MSSQNSNPNLVFVAGDVGPGDIFDKVAKFFPGSTCFLGMGGKTPMPSKDEVAKAVSVADGVVVGISSALEKIDLEAWAACCAFDNGKLAVAVGDIVGTLTKRYADQVTDYIHLGLVVSPAEIEGTSSTLPNIAIRAVGNPTWETYFKPATSEAARALIGASEDEMIALVPGVKKPVFNGVMLMTVAGAMQRLIENVPSHGPFRLVFAPHPGEAELFAPPKDDGTRIWPGIWDVREYFPNITIQVLDGIKTDDVLPGVNIVFDLGRSAAGTHAIARRIPLVAVKVPGSTEYLRRETGEAESFVAAHRASIRPQNPLALSGLLDAFMQGTSVLTEQKEAQERFMPPMMPGSSVAMITSAINDALDARRVTA